MMAIQNFIWFFDESGIAHLPPMLELNAAPTTHRELLAEAATSPAHRVPCLQEIKCDDFSKRKTLFCIHDTYIHTYPGLRLIFHTRSRTVLGFTQPMSPRGAVLWACIHQLPGFSIAPYSFIPGLLGSARPFGAGNLDGSAPHYGNQSRGYFSGGRPPWPPAVPRLAARPSQSNPSRSGPEVLKRERGHVTVETWSFCGGGLQGPPA